MSACEKVKEKEKARPLAVRISTVADKLMANIWLG